MRSFLDFKKTAQNRCGSLQDSYTNYQKLVYSQTGSYFPSPHHDTFMVWVAGLRNYLEHGNVIIWNMATPLKMERFQNSTSKIRGNHQSQSHPNSLGTHCVWDPVLSSKGEMERILFLGRRSTQGAVDQPKGLISLSQFTTGWKGKCQVVIAGFLNHLQQHLRW